MTLILYILFATMAWVISATRLVKILQRKAWNSDRVAVHIWWATFLFAIVVTFLVTPAGEWIDRYTLPNFARYIAYVSMILTLYLIVTAFLSTIQTRGYHLQLDLLQPFLITGLILLTFLYVLFVSKSPGWINDPDPSNAAQAVFQLIPFFWATILSFVLAYSCWKYLRLETVAVTRYRIILILLTGASSVLMFACKFIFILGFFWYPLKGGLIQSANSILEISTVLLWGGSFLHNSVYTRMDAFVHGLRNWAAYRDISYLASRLRLVCPSVGLEYQQVGFWPYIRRADYYLYQAVVSILDGKVMLSDSFENYQPKQGEPMGLPIQLFSSLQQAGTPQAFEEMVSAYGQVGRKLRVEG